MKFPSIFMLPLMAVACPVNTASAASELNYQSAFESYQAYTESETQQWPEAIKRVEEIGGWRVYAREMRDREPDARLPEAGPAETPKGTAHSHGGVQ